MQVFFHMSILNFDYKQNCEKVNEPDGQRVIETDRRFD